MHMSCKRRSQQGFFTCETAFFSAHPPTHPTHHPAPTPHPPFPRDSPHRGISAPWQGAGAYSGRAPSWRRRGWPVRWPANWMPGAQAALFFSSFCLSFFLCKAFVLFCQMFLDVNGCTAGKRYHPVGLANKPSITPETIFNHCH